MWGPDVPVVPTQTAARWFSIAVLGFVSFGVFCSYVRPEIPAVRREYPFSGLVSELGSFEDNKVRPSPVMILVPLLTSVQARVEQDTEADE